MLFHLHCDAFACSELEKEAFVNAFPLPRGSTLKDPLRMIWKREVCFLVFSK